MTPAACTLTGSPMWKCFLSQRANFTRKCCIQVFSQVANFAGENDPCGLYADRLANVEILRVLLLLIIEPAPQNTPPHLMQVQVATAEPVFLNFYGAQEAIPRNEFRQPM
jgi:hypothetical protein